MADEKRDPKQNTEGSSECTESVPSYNLRKKDLSKEKKLDENIEEAIGFIHRKKDKKGFSLKTVNEEIGKGVFAAKFYKAGQFLLEYDGELVCVTEGRRREKEYPLELGSYLYFFVFKGKHFCIDATFSKRKGRYINDGIGQQENAKMKRLEVDGRPYLALFALREIQKGEEIRFDYGVPNLCWRKKQKDYALWKGRRCGKTKFISLGPTFQM